MAPPVTDPLVRLTEKTVVRENGCWEWTGLVEKDGYGRMWVGSRTDGSRRPARVNRISYELNCGPVGDMHVCHRCDNRLCIRPEHLFLGSHADNMADMVSKHRSASGERHGRSTKPWRTARGERNGMRRHTNEQIAEAVSKCAYTVQARVAEEYGVHVGTIERWLRESRVSIRKVG